MLACEGLCPLLLGPPLTLTFLKEFTASSQAQFVVSSAAVTAAGLTALAVVLGHQVGEGSATTAATAEAHGALTLVQLQRPGSILHTLPLLRDTAGLQVSTPPPPSSCLPHLPVLSLPMLSLANAIPCHLQLPASPSCPHLAGPTTVVTSTARLPKAMSSWWLTSLPPGPCASALKPSKARASGSELLIPSLVHPASPWISPPAGPALPQPPHSLLVHVGSTFSETQASARGRYVMIPTWRESTEKKRTLLQTQLGGTEGYLEL